MMVPIDVAVGVLIRPDGSFLIAQRPQGKPMPGYWEFPGGKVEPGESIFEALRRELIEELDITIVDAHRWAERVFVYPHATVRLHYWRATHWQGEPRALEFQQFKWERIERVIDQTSTGSWLPGALPLKRWLQLPALYAISNATRIGVTSFLNRLDAKLQAGEIHMLQLREKLIDPTVFARLFPEVLARVRDHGVRLLINSDHPEHYWHEADGVHGTGRMLMNATARPACDWCAASCHNTAEIEQAGELDFDFAVLGPVNPTASHPGTPALGWAGFDAASAKTAIPVYALGGLSQHDLRRAIEHGAQGIAAMGAVWG